MKTKQPLILVTNDDGITSPGIRLLINIAKTFGSVIVAAPNSAQSAKSHSITVEEVITSKCIEKTENYAEYSISGTPVDCVKLAIHKLCDQKPDFLLSGINHGTNTSSSLIYSGTMAAAIEGSMNDIQSVGFSVNNHDTQADFSFTIPYINTILKKFFTEKLSYGTSLNVNFPAIEKGAIKGIKICRSAVGMWQEDFVEANHPHGKSAFWLSGSFKNLEPSAQDTDEFAVTNNYISVMPVKIDFTDYENINLLNSWKL